MVISVWWALAAAMAGATVGFFVCAALTLSARREREACGNFE